MNTKDKVITEFKKLKKILDDSGHEFTLIAGSMLGAVEFNGFIPWDDDVDIMISPDTLQFLLDKFPDNVLMSNDDGYPLMFPKWVPDKTNISESNIFIDLFVVVRTNEKRIKKFRSFKNKLKFANYSLKKGFRPFDVPLWVLKIILFPFGWMSRKNISYTDALKILSDDKGNRNFLIVNPADPIRAADVTIISEERIETSFEGMMIKIPKNYSEYLKYKYGDINVNVNKTRKILIHTNTYNVEKAYWNGKKIITKNNEYR